MDRQTQSFQRIVFVLMRLGRRGPVFVALVGLPNRMGERQRQRITVVRECQPAGLLSASLVFRENLIVRRLNRFVAKPHPLQPAEPPGLPAKPFDRQTTGELD